MALRKFVKDPNARLDYVIDWSAWLDAIGDTITGAEVADPPAGLTVTTPIEFTSSNTTVWIAGGTAGVSYDVTVRITTAGGRVDDRTIVIACKEL